jgi:hypothetical protein
MTTPLATAGKEASMSTAVPRYVRVFVTFSPLLLGSGRVAIHALRLRKEQARFQKKNVLHDDDNNNKNAAANY